METKTEKWYDKEWLVVVLCVIFFPVGLYALWKNSSISIGWKIGVTGFFAVLIIVSINSDDKPTDAPGDSTIVEEKPVLKQLSNDEYYQKYSDSFDSIKLQQRFKEGGPLYKQYADELYAVLVDMKTTDSLYQILADPKLKKLFDKNLSLTEGAMANYSKYGEPDEDLVFITSACEIALGKYLNDPDYETVNDKYYLKQTSNGYDYKMKIRAKNAFGAYILKELKFSLIFDPSSQTYSVTNIK